MICSLDGVEKCGKNKARSEISSTLSPLGLLCVPEKRFFLKASIDLRGRESLTRTKIVHRE